MHDTKMCAQQPLAPRLPMLDKAEGMKNTAAQLLAQSQMIRGIVFAGNSNLSECGKECKPDSLDQFMDATQKQLYEAVETLAEVIIALRG